MPTDAQLLARRLTLPSKFSDADAARFIANETGLSEDSLRGRLSRAKRGSQSWADAIEAAIYDRYEESTETLRQQAVIDKSQHEFEEYKRDLFAHGDYATGLFISDFHYPYVRLDGLELVRLILQYLQPNFVSHDNDLLDNEENSHWGDPRSHYAKAWSEHVSNKRAVEAAHIGMIKEASPYSQLVQVIGNHDLWWYKKQRESSEDDAEDVIATYMEWKHQQGVMIFSSGSKENVVELSDTLVWTHGQYCDKKLEARAAKELADQAKDRRFRSVVVGHTHRPGVIDGANFGMPGVRYYNSGCVSRLEAVPYRKRDPNTWGMGVVYSRFDNNFEEGELIRFEERGNALVARVEGTLFETELNKRAPRR